MGEYIVSARKYRPSNFKSVVGQKNLTTTLKNAIDSERIAQAYLFCGPRGVGKTSCARIFAKTINCLHPTDDGEACGECESCRAIERGASFNIIELDAASHNSVDDIRSLNDEVNIPPQTGKYKVFIIDEVHMLTTSAFNAFLKTLEEPPKYVIFILATTEKHKVIPTILSRCQIYDFKRITTADIVEHLQYVASHEGIQANAEALNVIARKADGAMRDALSIFDQVASSSMGNITYQSALANLNVLDYEYYFRLVEAFRSSDTATALLVFNEIQEKGFDTLFFINGLASHIRDLMVAADERTAKLLEVAEEVVVKYTLQARSLPLQWYFAALKLINDCDYHYRTATNKQLLVELMLIRLCQLLNPPSPPFDRVDNVTPLQSINTNKTDPKPNTMVSEPSANKAETKLHNVNKSQTPAHQPPNSNKETVAKKSARKTSRLSDLEAEYDSETLKTKDRRNKFSSGDLNEAWEEFIRNNGEKPLLISAMKESVPVKTNEEEYMIKVAHPAQKQAVLSNLSYILDFLRGKLQNDFISITVEINEINDIKKPMPTKELFQDILSQNPSIGKIAEMLDVEII